jgi:hypothetical protein
MKLTKLASVRLRHSARARHPSGVENAFLAELTAVGDSLFFVAVDGEASHLWTSDGTEHGTTLLL